MKVSHWIVAAVFALMAAACSRSDSDRAAPKKEEAARPAGGGAEEGFGSLTVDEVSARLGKRGVYLIDNNPRHVWESGHLPTATWVDYKTMTAADLPADKSATLIFYCANEH